MNRLNVFRVLVLISVRNLRSHWAKTLIVGSILFFGTALWTIGSSLIGSIENAMSRTIVESVTGHLQIYQDGTRDTLALFGGGSFGAPDIGEIPNFEDLLRAVDGVENVKAIVPMGTTIGLLSNPSQLDAALGDLRTAAYDADAERQREAEARTRYLMELLLEDSESRLHGQQLTAELEQNLADLRYALSATFWTEYAANPLERLEFLDTRIAPQGTDGSLVYLRLLGTDLEQYRKVFGQFEIFEGEPVPPGERGLMMPYHFREQFLKNRVARDLDAMKKRVDDGFTFVEDDALQEKARSAVRQYKRLLVDLDPGKRDALQSALESELGRTGRVDELLQEYLRIDDANFSRRFAHFYSAIAPLVRLYPVEVGESVTVRAFTRSGYMRSANLKLYGIFHFKGMEQSFAGIYNLVDIMTFRELYGAITARQRDELSTLKEEVGITDVGAENAEDALFGGDSLVVEESGTSAVSVDQLLAASGVEAAGGEKFTREDVESGLALHAAVVLENPELLFETRAALDAAVKGANLPLRVVPWQQAAGFAGQLTMAMRAVLLFGMVIIFLMALVVMNNTVIISTMERTSEIGTLRAIGAQRPFILLMFLLETMAIAVLAGVAGALAGAALVGAMAVNGIPAFTDQLVFLFGGPRLFPVVSAADMVTGLIIILIVSMVATYFPARGATRVQPVEAMRGAD